MSQQTTSVKNKKVKLLVDRCQQGDRDSFAQLMKLHQKQIYNYTYRMLGSAEEAEDLTQDIFIAAFRGIKNFRGEAKFSTWLYRIALNQTRNRIKYLARRNFFSKQVRKKGLGEEMDLETPETLADSGPTPEQWTMTRDLVARVQECLSQMGHQARQILILRDVQGFAYEELSEMLSLKPGTVKSRLHRARSSLQKCLAEKLE